MVKKNSGKQNPGNPNLRRTKAYRVPFGHDHLQNDIANDQQAGEFGRGKLDREDI
jgi:hypothetical protein